MNTDRCQWVIFLIRLEQNQITNIFFMFINTWCYRYLHIHSLHYWWLDSMCK